MKNVLYRVIIIGLINVSVLMIFRFLPINSGWFSPKKEEPKGWFSFKKEEPKGWFSFNKKPPTKKEQLEKFLAKEDIAKTAAMVPITYIPTMSAMTIAHELGHLAIFSLFARRLAGRIHLGNPLNLIPLPKSMKEFRG
jgi:hypothetical protein